MNELSAALFKVSGFFHIANIQLCFCGWLIRFRHQVVDLNTKEYLDLRKTTVGLYVHI